MSSRYIGKFCPRVEMCVFFSPHEMHGTEDVRSSSLSGFIHWRNEYLQKTFYQLKNVERSEKTTQRETTELKFIAALGYCYSLKKWDKQKEMNDLTIAIGTKSKTVEENWTGDQDQNTDQ